MKNIIKEYSDVIRKSKKHNQYRSPLELCSIKLDYLPLVDTFFIKINKGGVIEFQAHREDVRDDAIISISYEKIIPTLIFMKSHYSPILRRIKKSGLSPSIFFYYENFTSIDKETKQLFRNIAKYFKIPLPLTCKNKLYLHILCRHFAKTVMYSMIMHELFIQEHKDRFGGYFWGLKELKKLLESELFN